MNLLSPLHNISRHWLPTSIIILLIIGVLLMIVVVFYTSRALKRGATKKEPPKAPPAEPSYPIREDKLPPLLAGPLSAFLVRKGWFKVGELARSFLRGLQFLRSRLDTLNYKYRLPWYLMIGPAQSGKSTLLNSSELNLPVGQPDLYGGEVHPGCTWWFFNRAVVLDIRGDFLIHEHGSGSDERGWRGLLALLTRYRSLRPIDGIILCIAADELYGRWRLSREELHDRARMLGQKLRATQLELGLRLPVYVIVTKCDTLPGFQTFCAAIPEAHRHDILGWSCPYTLSTAFQPAWVEDIFEQVYRTLIHVRLEIFSRGHVQDGTDGLFVLPSEFTQLKEPLGNYLQSIFKESAYEESLLLRGVYFTGDAGEKADPHFLTRLFASTQLPAKSEDVPQDLLITGRRIFFANHVLNERIFREFGLAEPIYRRIVTANRGLNVAKAAMALLMTLGTFGLLRAYDTFSMQRDFLIPSLNKVLGNIRELQLTRETDNRAVIEKFDNYAREMIELMTKMGKTHFFSIFSPPSWFSGVERDLKKALASAYEEIVIRTLYQDLQLRAKDLLMPLTVPVDKTTSIAQLLQPMTMPEAIRLKTFVANFIELASHIDKYNRLNEANDASLLTDLVKYAFDVAIPSDFESSYQEFRSVIRKVPTPPIDLRSYLPTAKQRLLKLYREFVTTLMSPKNPQSLLGRINEIVRTFGQREVDRLPDIEVLRRFHQEASKILETLGEPGKTWLDSPYFDPGSGFGDLMQQIAQSPFFGMELVQTMAKETAPLYTNFIEQLARLNAVLGRTPQVATPTASTVSPTPQGMLAQAVSALQAPQTTATQPPQATTPAQAVIEFDKSLKNLLSEPFMAPADMLPLKPTIPPGKVVYWDVKLIDAALDMIKAYDEFLNKKLDQYPTLLQGMIRLVAADMLQKNIISHIGRSQQFMDTPKGDSEGATSEGIIRSKIKVAKEIEPKFIKLLEVLEKSQAGPTFVQLRDMMADAGYKLLTYVETLLQTYPPFAIRENGFEWWDGQDPPALYGYGVKDAVDLKTYLQLQADRMRLLGLEYAESTVNFLSDPIFREAQIDRSLVNRWRRIIDQLKLEDKKRPESSVRALSEFIEKDLSTITLKNCFEKVTTIDAKDSSGDYFLQIRQNLRRGILSRCEVLRRRRTLLNYDELVDFFKSNLQGKFPFVGGEASSETPEVEPQELREFYKLYEEAGGNPRKILDQVYQLGASSDDAMVFLTDMETIKDFFKTYLTDPRVPAPFIDYIIEFRVNKANEKGANFVIEWYISPNADTKVTNNDKAKTGRWVFDQPVKMGFRWPDGIETKPFRDKEQPFMTVEGQTAVFNFPGRWSLLWLLRKYQATPKDLADSNETKPYVLRFEIPTGPESKAVVYNRLTLTEPPKGKTPGKMLNLPNFPTNAPPIPDSIRELRDKPVLAQGAIKPVDNKEFAPKLEPEAPPAAPAEGKPPKEAAAKDAAAKEDAAAEEELDEAEELG